MAATGVRVCPTLGAQLSLTPWEEHKEGRGRRRAPAGEKRKCRQQNGSQLEGAAEGQGGSHAPGRQMLQLIRVDEAAAWLAKKSE